MHDEAIERRSGLATALNVIIAPREAYETLRETPMWGWAFLIASLLGVVGFLLLSAATAHALGVALPQQFAHDPRMAQMSAAERERMMSVSLSITRWLWLATPLFVLLGSLIQTLIMLVGNAVARGSATFKQLWAAAINTSIVSFGLSSFVIGFIARLRGADSFNSTADLATVMPSLAWIVPHAGAKAAQFLGAINPFTIWGIVLLGLALIVIARISKGMAYGIATVAALLSIALGALFAR